MKRKIEPDKDDDEQRRKQSLRERTVGFNVQDSDGGFSQGLLTFTWADKNSSEIKLPSYENKELEARFEKVYKVFQTSFHEIIVKMNSSLKSYGVKICKTKLTDNNVVSMHSNAYASVSINVKGRLLLYAFVSYTDHKHSYIQETTYFFLKSTKIPVPNPTGLNGTYIRGHERRSLDPVLKRLKFVEKDETFIVDEYKSTVNCSSCFELTTKQIIRVGDHGRKRIKGAVICTNEICPRRLSSRSSTINRDQNGAMNIALIGFCHLVSEDGLTLQPFRRSDNNSNKFHLSKNFQRTSLATLRSSGVPDN
ncbi:hypothetical protein INT47_011450 [Mucor saturninus]|uniref:Uncharacterized protein n=1 Tax=Mucor saturninus TaxID=64648 RepID=A0A8H7QYA9_9FUNG|nr:hypothetical protein INT47_011450 [Mucor saturninus]